VDGNLKEVFEGWFGAPFTMMTSVLFQTVTPKIGSEIGSRHGEMKLRLSSGAYTLNRS
jgi:hypothetical protein